MSIITALRTHDVRFPTSEFLDGSDAMNPDPDYSAAYCVIETDADDGLTGHGFVFTIGRGNDVVLAAIQDLEAHIKGKNVEDLLAHMGATSKSLIYDSQLRWLGPEKGVEHMAIGAVLTALWDLKAKRAGKPLWQLLATMSPEELVECVDFRYLRDALTEEEALEILRKAEPGREERMAKLLEEGYPGYTTTPGWLGYSDEKMMRLAREAVEVEGFKQIKLKVGGSVEEDRRRLRKARETVGPDIKIAVDANQVWDVPDAIEWIKQLAEFDIAWVEEPTSPDDVLGHAAIAKAIAPTPVATGEQMQNRIMAKQFLQANALSVLQLDSTRVAGPNENIAMLLLAAKFGVRVCPHAGGVGLCELICHMSMFDYVAVSGTTEDRYIEYVHHLHEHFLTPVVIKNGHYQTPTTPGASSEMYPESIERYTFKG
ncbi:enolase C-terminal domain-like protein [Actinotignum urinale]|uniref:L-fuconate dehydratase n=1 Tax=Actinotignum urinale TaxID=190146 RepID=A0AAW9HLN5_9ACTO|nr:enolase C-terminal domain-like protein [Actinotignum urinale]MDY5128975.1 enolase C-terminal domain-like protein [Actinotignum urinale]MDY5132469.1 enolase C-terminal domain-like protein [Actinotignum urinale]MDY5151051.1 enolase C-terminal domain-like protein [Actinotignum urinale]MDY5154776.1 enolase C-terminal domain-like protein [Actinotignum urinale]MDY5159930.1 enolase C-terminal domain-like protein [Actinotignum urinale]